MRGTPKGHTPPANTQPCPFDNSQAHVMAQVRRWAAGEYGNNTPSLIHHETAMEIAAWWHAPNNAFAAFSHTGGTIVDGFLDEIAAVLSDRELGTAHVLAIRALDAYVRAVLATNLQPNGS